MRRGEYSAEYRYSLASPWKNRAAEWANRDLKPHPGDRESSREPGKTSVETAAADGVHGLSASPSPQSDSTEAALAEALVAATAAGRFDLGAMP
jgi:hypothetical protein